MSQQDAQCTRRWSTRAAALPGTPWRCSTGRPGFRIPHVPLHRDGATLSTLDLVGTGPVLLTGPRGATWVRGFVAACGIGPDGAVLVRPDGFVAWRASGAVDDSVRVLGTALARSLRRAWS